MRSKGIFGYCSEQLQKSFKQIEKAIKSSESEEISLAFNRGFSEGQFNYASSRSIRSGHIGLKLGKVCNSENNQIVIRLDDDLKTIPQKGDGLLLIKAKDDYGFEIS